MRSVCALRLGILLVAALALGTGCFLDEIDKAGSWQKTEKPKSEAPAPAAAQPPAEKKPNWWATATSLGSEESRADIVRCDVGNSTQYMGRDDCQARGGKVQ